MLTSLAALLWLAQAEIRPGVWAGSTAQALPLPVQGYQLYMVGEFHGIEQNASFQLQYLELLRRKSGLRDVVVEEKSVYESQAQAYVDGSSPLLPADLCLRSPVLGGIRKMNASIPASRRIRVHLTDIDSPPAAIREHLLNIQARVGKAASVVIPAADSLKEQGLAAVDQLTPLAASNPQLVAELRTVAHSIRAAREGFEAGVGQSKGSPYLEDREQAIASNILDLVRAGKSALVLYGGDHVSRARRNGGGPKRDQPFIPMALRLEQAGVHAFSIFTTPLSGRAFWRGRGSGMLWTAADGSLQSGETFEKLLSSLPHPNYIYIERKRNKANLIGDDANNSIVDAAVLFPIATPLPNLCATK